MTDAGATGAGVRSCLEKCDALDTLSDTATDLEWAETGLALMPGSMSLALSLARCDRCVSRPRRLREICIQCYS